MVCPNKHAVRDERGATAFMRRHKQPTKSIGKLYGEWVWCLLPTGMHTSIGTRRGSLDGIVRADESGGDEQLDRPMGGSRGNYERGGTHIASAYRSCRADYPHRRHGAADVGMRCRLYDSEVGATETRKIYGKTKSLRIHPTKR